MLKGHDRQAGAGHRLTFDGPRRIQEEFEEAPGLVITVNQGERFWAND
jgi:hypothetical protein